MGDNVFERGFYGTLGAGLLLYETAGRFVEDLVQRGRLAPEEGRKFLDEFVERVEKERDELRARLRSEVQEVVKGLDLPTAGDLEGLRTAVAGLENRVTLLEAAEVAAEHKPPVAGVAAEKPKGRRAKS